ncbi:ATP-binding protein [Lysinibacillus sp. LZ02]|uniref:ATP-binding protein n=1 Tax=Lysinibacillus sp. LZ02 TaxID=3420668 RepID=UPI003D368327
MLDTYRSTDWTIHRKYLPRFERVVLIQVMEGVLNEEQAKKYFDYAVFEEEHNQWLLQPIAYEYVDDEYVIVYEDFIGQPLQQLVKQQMPLHQFLHIAIELVNACISLHQKGLLYGQLNPKYIFVHATSLQVRLVKSPMTTKWGPSAGRDMTPAFELDELPYWAPEQTGRLSIEIDERTDLYTLGTIFYEMITLNKPFQADNTVDCIFDILTRVPNFSPFEKGNDLTIIKMMVQKLLEKNPEDRYQSAVSLKEDLLRIQQQIADGKSDIVFPLGQRDQQIRPKPSNKLCGREDEINVLIHMLDEVKQGAQHIVFIKGPSGCGKSSLAHRLRSEVAHVKGYFVDCKFDQLQKQHAFTSILQPLRHLLKQVYVEGEASIKQFQQGMQEVNLMMAESLLRVIPELRWFLSDETELLFEDLQYTLQMNAYIFASIQKILAIFSRQRCPIVWFVDDLQWADQSALNMLKDIYDQHSGGYFLLIMAVRDDASTMDQQLLAWQTELASFCTIYLHLLTEGDVRVWLADSLKMQSETTVDVAKRLYRMTQGNPLFMHEVFRLFLNNRTLYFDLTDETWQFNQQQLQQTIVNQELLGFISGRIDMLSAQAQAILRLASCFGREFELHLLLKLANIPFSELIERLEELVEQGFILALDSRLKWARSSDREDGTQLFTMKLQFVHDRIQQTAYESLEERNRIDTHYTIGQLLIQMCDNMEESPYLQEIVRQFNYCINRLTAEEQQQLAIWNAMLGGQAKKAGLYQNALQFFSSSLALLPVDHWAIMREMSLQMYMDLGECEYLVGDYADSKKHIEEALHHAETTLEKLLIYRLMSLIYIESESSEIVINAGFSAFQLCHMHIDREPTKAQVLKEFLLLKWELKNKTDEYLMHLPPIENKEIDVLIQIMISIVSNTFRMSPNLTGILLLRVFRLQLKYGATTESGIVYINYALMLISGFNNVKQALRFGKLALSMADSQNSLFIKARIYFTYGIFLNHWEKDYDTSVQYMRVMQQYGEQVGLFYQVTAMSCFLCATQLMNGTPLQQLDEEVQFQQAQYVNYPNMLSDDYLTEFQHWVSALRHANITPKWDYEISLQHEEAVVVMHYILRLQMAYLFQDEQQACRILEETRQPIKEVYSLPNTPIYFLYRALWQFDLIEQPFKHREKRRQYVKEIKESIRKFKKWAKEAPHNFEHLYMLLLAENCRRKRLDGEAILYYDRAIQLAKVHQFPQDEAIIYERAAKYYEAQQDQVKTSDYSMRGIREMRKWGAVTIAALWEERFSQYIQVQQQKKEYALSFDMMTVLEATQSLAKEIRMEDLLHKLLFSLLKQSNATSGYFIRHQQGKLNVLAKAQAEAMQFTYYSEPTSPATHIQLIADYTLQSEEAVVISDVNKSTLFTHLKIAAKSILCLPVYHKGEVTAVLYLENTLLQNAFSTTPIELIAMIATQIVVSLENAEIYMELENRVEARTKELGEMNLHLKKINDQLAMHELERKKLLHSISHELRSPITSTLGYIEAILDGVVVEPAQQQFYLMRSKERLLSLNGLIQDLFDLAKLEAGRLEYALTKVSVQGFYDRLAYYYIEDIRRAGLNYQTNCCFEKEASILIDTARIQQVVTNIIMNAIKYTNQGNIIFMMWTENGELYCSIEDSGMGIPEKDIQFIFDSYYSASNSQNVDSNGIGLAICKRIIEQHGGRIFVESVEQQGSRFCFTLPLMAENA